jgi:hypothetical protein
MRASDMNGCAVRRALCAPRPAELGDLREVSTPRTVDPLERRFDLRGLHLAGDGLFVTVCRPHLAALESRNESPIRVDRPGLSIWQPCPHGQQGSGRAIRRSALSAVSLPGPGGAPQANVGMAAVWLNRRPHDRRARLRDLGRALSAVLRTVAGSGSAGASGVERFVERLAR